MVPIPETEPRPCRGGSTGPHVAAELSKTPAPALFQVEQVKGDRFFSVMGSYVLWLTMALTDGARGTRDRITGGS